MTTSRARLRFLTGRGDDVRESSRLGAGAAANIMRRILVDDARQRGDGVEPVDFAAITVAIDPGRDITDLHTALTEFDAIDP
ncbi:MAG: hypothetical protein HYR60_12130 [Acidobacteria bacterium]|nr:hypothetical protein [Acidobacteriota bacterium]